MKILLIDIETSPYTTYVWGMFKQFVNPDNIIDTAYVMCYSAKWLGEDTVFFDSVYQSNTKKMLKGVHKLLDEADAVVHYNGTKFDIPILNREFLLHGMTPNPPYKQMDLLKVAKNKFKFASNKLDFIAKQLGLGGKVKTPGMKLWIDCMAKDDNAWKIMEEYNKHDVILLEKVYDKFKPWIKQHANYSVINNELVCPNCNGHHYQKRGFAYTQTAKYQRYQCKDCGNWFRGGKSLAGSPEEKFVNV